MGNSYLTYRFIFQLFLFVFKHLSGQKPDRPIQSSCKISILGSIEKLTGHSPEHPALGKGWLRWPLELPSHLHSPMIDSMLCSKMLFTITKRDISSMHTIFRDICLNLFSFYSSTALEITFEFLQKSQKDLAAVLPLPNHLFMVLLPKTTYRMDLPFLISLFLLTIYK